MKQIDPFVVVGQLKRTINVPLYLGDLSEELWTVKLTSDHLDEIQRVGFTAVRLAICWAAHTAEAAPYTIPLDTFDKVEWAVKAATKRGLTVILDNHLDLDLMTDPSAYKERFLSITQQVAEYFKNYPTAVLFEILAEPQGKLDNVWNAYFAEALEVVRRVDTQHTVIVGPNSYNSARKLAALELPDDQNLIVTVHHYWPIKFTMQGETWLQLPWFMRLILGNPKKWKGVKWEGTTRQRLSLQHTFDQIAAWGTEHNRPIFLGEFGASNNAEMASRVRWMRYVHEQAEARSISWGCWSFGPSFALYDLEQNRWHDELLKSLE